MAQATTVHSTKTLASPLPHKPALSAYMDLEADICDLLLMAQIASEQIYTCVGELECVDGEPREAPTGHDVQAALFASSHVVQMLQKLRDDYYSHFDTINR